MLVQDYTAKFKDLILRCGVREHHSHTVIRFVWDLRSKIRLVMFTGYYNLDIVQEAFDVVLKIDLIFKRLVNAKAQCSKCERYEH